jgi:tripartite-type tricarboxylate transporter receptor subunit TctC
MEMKMPEGRCKPISIADPGRRRLLGTGGALAVSGALPRMAAAQDAWPKKAVRLVVPFAPGGSSDVVSRSIAVELTRILGQSVFVDNKPGAAGNIAMAEVARANDQHTLILGHIGTLAVNPYIFPKLTWDPAKDFRPISLLAKVPSLYVVYPELPAKDMRDFVAYARSKPGKLSYGSAGNGSAGHLAIEYLKMAADLEMTHIPYRGTGPMLIDLVAGRLEASAVGAPAILPFIQSGKVRCIATGSSKRLEQLPDVPTVAEQGFPDFEMTQWYGLLAPSSLAPENVAKLSDATMKGARSPAFVERLSGDAAEAIGDSPEQFARFIATEQTRWQKVIARAKITPD